MKFYETYATKISFQQREDLELMFRSIPDRFHIASIMDSIGYNPSLIYTEQELRTFRKKISKGTVYHLCRDFSCGKGLKKTQNYIRSLII